MDADRLDAKELAALAAGGRDWAMVHLGVLPVTVHARREHDLTLACYLLGERLTLVWADCPGHGPTAAVVALLDGQVVQLGQVQDAEQLAAAIVDHPGLDERDAGELLAELDHARIGP